MKLSEKKGGVALSYIQMVLNVLVKFIYTPFLLRALGQNEYGLFSLIMSIVGYLAILDMGFGSTLTRYAVKYRSEGDQEGLYKLYSTLSVIYIIIGIVALLICVVLSQFTESIFGSTMTDEEVYKLKIMILLCGINLLFTFPLQISVSVLAAHEKFIFKNSVILLRTILQPVILVLLLYLIEIKSIGAIVVVTAFNFLNYFIYYVYSVKKLDFKFYVTKFTPKMIPTLLSFSGWMFALMVYEHLQFNSGQFILGMFQSSSVIAVWGIALIFILNFRSLSTAITNVFLPSFLKMTFNHNKEFLLVTIQKMVRIQSLILSIILFNFFLFGYQFIYEWAGDKYTEAYRCALIVMVPMSISLILDFSYLYQMATKQLAYRFFTFLGALIISFMVIYNMGEINLNTFALMMALSMTLGPVVCVLIYIRNKMHISFSLIFKDIIKKLCVLFFLTIIFRIYLYNVTMFDNTMLNLIFNVVVFNLFLISLIWKFFLTNEERNSVLRIRV